MLLQKRNLNKSIFISKSADEVIELAEFCKKNKIQLFAESMIRFEHTAFQLNKSFDVVFFGSYRAFKYYLKQEKLDPVILIACIGKTTAEKIEKHGFKVDFIGVNSGKPDEVAKTFKTWLGGRTVLIPQSNISKRSIAKVIPEKQLAEVVVYKTISDCKRIPECETYIFSSPSNFESFLTCNEMPKGKIIAWGETTAETITSNGYQVFSVLKKSEMKELIALLQ